MLHCKSNPNPIAVFYLDDERRHAPSYMGGGTSSATMGFRVRVGLEGVHCHCEVRARVRVGGTHRHCEVGLWWGGSGACGSQVYSMWAALEVGGRARCSRSSRSFAMCSRRTSQRSTTTCVPPSTTPCTTLSPLDTKHTPCAAWVMTTCRGQVNNPNPNPKGDDPASWAGQQAAAGRRPRGHGGDAHCAR